MKLEDLLGEDLWKQVQAKIDEANKGQEDKTKHIRYADLSEGGYVAKDKYNSLDSDLQANKDELKKANDLIEQMKKDNSSNEDLQNKITTYESEIATLQSENEKLKIDNALQFALKDAGASDVDYLMFKAKEQGELKLDDDGKIKGIDNLITTLKTELPAQFASKDGEGEGRKKLDPNDLPSGEKDQTVTKDQFLKMGYDERLKLKKESPEQYEKLTKK